VSDIAGRLGRSFEDVVEALQAREGRSARSLDVPVHDEVDDLATPGDSIGRNDPGYERAEARATVERLTPLLDDHAREVLRLRFEEDPLQSDIAERIGCSRAHL
jgi:RNA polymerase sigma-B factor